MQMVSDSWVENLSIFQTPSTSVNSNDIFYSFLEPNTSSFEGTVCWAAPEVVPPKPPKKKGKYTTAADVYSYGITFWEMITNRRPYRGYKFEYQVNQKAVDSLWSCIQGGRGGTYMTCGWMEVCHSVFKKLPTSNLPILGVTTLLWWLLAERYAMFYHFCRFLLNTSMLKQARRNEIDIGGAASEASWNGGPGLAPGKIFRVHAL